MDQHINIQQEIEQFIAEFQRKLNTVHQKLQDLPSQLKQINEENFECTSCINGSKIYSIQASDDYQNELEIILNKNLAKDGSWKNQEKSKLLIELLSAGHGALSWRRAWQGQTKTWPSQSLAGQDQAAEAGRPADMFDR
ncbi:unnamed protein product [Lupinus luteus]|uniref:Uncharacterized protein n=1 Tax=Lupinus luteus TaxID=3873 RepID=A0AAV1Y777_LUPLU